MSSRVWLCSTSPLGCGCDIPFQAALEIPGGAEHSGCGGGGGKFGQLMTRAPLATVFDLARPCQSLPDVNRVRIPAWIVGTGGGLPLHLLSSVTAVI